MCGFGWSLLWFSLGWCLFHDSGRKLGSSLYTTRTAMMCTLCVLCRNQYKYFPQNWWWKEKKLSGLLEFLSEPGCGSGLCIREQIDIMKNDVLASKKLHHRSYSTALYIFTSPLLLSTRFRWNNFKLRKYFSWLKNISMIN